MLTDFFLTILDFGTLYRSLAFQLNLIFKNLNLKTVVVICFLYVPYCILYLTFFFHFPYNFTLSNPLNFSSFIDLLEVKSLKRKTIYGVSRLVSQVLRGERRTTATQRVKPDDKEEDGRHKMRVRHRERFKGTILDI